MKVGLGGTLTGGMLAALVAALIAVSLAPAAPLTASKPQTTVATTSTVVMVSMYEMGFKLSTEVVPPGTVIFQVVNDGKVKHDFRVLGHGTPILDPGERATLTVQFPKPGTFTFVCTVEGHAAAGMIGKLTVAVAVAAKRTVVAVSMYDKRFTLSKKVVPSGTVIFRVVNKGKVKHTFRIRGKRTKVLAPGKRATLTIQFPKTGGFTFVCTVTGHRGAGMVGKLVVK